MGEQACISRSARGAVWGVLTCLKGPKIFFACGALRIPLEISKETVFSLQCFSFGPGAVLGGAYMLVRQHARSSMGVVLKDIFSDFTSDVSRRILGLPQEDAESDSSSYSSATPTALSAKASPPPRPELW